MSATRAQGTRRSPRILIAANRVKSRLVYMGASQRDLAERLIYGYPIEQVLRDATCDVAVYRGIA